MSEKFFFALPKGAGKSYKTYEEAEEAAKRSVAGGNLYNPAADTYYILETTAMVKRPLPEAEVTKL